MHLLVWGLAALGSVQYTRLNRLSDNSNCGDGYRSNKYNLDSISHHLPPTPAHSRDNLAIHIPLDALCIPCRIVHRREAVLASLIWHRQVVSISLVPGWFFLFQRSIKYYYRMFPQQQIGQNCGFAKLNQDGIINSSVFRMRNAEQPAANNIF